MKVIAERSKVLGKILFALGSILLVWSGVALSRFWSWKYFFALIFGVTFFILGVWEGILMQRLEGCEA